MQPIASTKVLTAEEACAALRVSRVTLWRLIRRGYLRQVRGLRLVRIPETEIQRYVLSLDASTALRSAKRGSA